MTAHHPLEVPPVALSQAPRVQPIALPQAPPAHIESPTHWTLAGCYNAPAPFAGARPGPPPPGPQGAPAGGDPRPAHPYGVSSGTSISDTKRIAASVSST